MNLKDQHFYKNVQTFLKELKKFQYKFDGGRIWTIIFSDKNDRWYKLHVQQYKETFYISLIDGDVPALEVQPGKKIETSEWHRSAFGGARFDSSDVDPQWEPLISAAQAWLKRVARDWIKANALVMENYPTNRRKGYVPHSIVRTSLADVFRLDRELGNKNTAKFIKIHESRYFWYAKNIERSTMIAKIFFDYCKIAYVAARRKSEPDKIVKRLLAQDNIGIDPCDDSLHHANQTYPEEQDVFDVMHYDDLGRYKRTIRSFITWHPLPMLIPK